MEKLLDRKKLTQDTGETHISTPKNIPPCFMCGDKQPYDMVTTEDNQIRYYFYHHIFDGVNRFVCIRCFKIFVKIDQIIGKILLFFLKKR